ASMGADPIATAACALDILLAVNAHPGEPAARRAVRWLAARALPEGGFAPEGGSYDRTSSAHALIALVAAGAAEHHVIVATAKRLAAELDEGVAWEEAREIVEALAACEARRARRPRRARKPSVQASGGAHVPDALAADWAFCKESLGEV